jgi:hypothetical protein
MGHEQRHSKDKKKAPKRTKDQKRADKQAKRMA